MFGLTKREQRWKAEQQAAELLVALVQSTVRATADIRIAEANAEAERLRKENAELRAALGVAGTWPALTEAEIAERRKDAEKALAARGWTPAGDVVGAPVPPSMEHAPNCGIFHYADDLAECTCGVSVPAQHIKPITDADTK